MGNVPAKESRSRSNSSASFQSVNGSNTYNTSSSTYSAGGNGGNSGSAGAGAGTNRGSRHRRNTSSALYGVVTGGQNHHGHGRHQRSASSDLRKQKRQEEKDQKLYHHYLNLIVRHEENVDGGYLAPFGTYKSNLDYDVDIVRSLIVNRELSPFFTPLQDFDESWTDEELCILLSQLTLHALEEPTGLLDDEYEEDDLDNHKIHKSSNYYKRQEEKAKLKLLILKMKELQKEEENKYLMHKKMSNNNNTNNNGGSSNNNYNYNYNYNGKLQCPSNDLYLKLYRNATECPICFLYYPRHLNVSRCCLQPICTECFVQIKRLDPHPPHDDPSNQQAGEQPHSLISEPASCPYCAMPDFGVTYEPPLDIHTGINGQPPGEYKTVNSILEDEDEDGNGNGSGSGSGNKSESAVVDDDSFSPSPVRNHVGSPTSPPPVNATMKTQLLRKKGSGGGLVSGSGDGNRGKRRRSSVAANAPGVITIDMIRPDWEANLQSARSKLARKAATATAIHASNLIIDGSNGQNGGGGASSSSNGRARSSTSGSGANDGFSIVEQRMIEEAMRLSLLDEEERKRKAERKTKK